MRPSPRVIVSCLLLLGALLVLQFRSAGEAVPIRKPFDTFPHTVGSWRGQEERLFNADVLNILKADDYLMRRYSDPSGRSLWLYVGYWATQRKGAQIHSPRNCLPGGGWEPIEAGRATIPLQGHGQVTVNRYLIQKDREMQVVLYWYQSQGRVVAGELPAKIEMVRSAILRNRTDGALVRVSSPVSGGVEETTARLVTYVQALFPVLDGYLPN